MYAKDRRKVNILAVSDLELGSVPYDRENSGQWAVGSGQLKLAYFHPRGWRPTP